MPMMIIKGILSGSYKDLTIGGINSNAVLDDLGPEIELFMNDTSFVSGGITDSNPELLAKVFDSSGINCRYWN